MLRICAIDNLSAAAYRLRVPEFDHSLRCETPARVHELVAQGCCDAALLPAASLPEFSGEMEPLGAYGIACNGAVQSVQLFSREPLETLLRERRPIYATPKSRTSIRLLEILCQRKYGIRPVFTTSYPRGDAHLLIGDAAFECAYSLSGLSCNIDLGAWWKNHTGLPFVYARWVVSRNLAPAHRDALAAWLESCASQAAAPEGAARQAGHHWNDAEDAARCAYYQHIHPRLLADDLAGLRLFLELMEASAYEPVARIA